MARNRVFKIGFHPFFHLDTSKKEKIQAAREYVKEKREKWFREFSEIKNLEVNKDDWFKFSQEKKRESI